MLLLKSFGSPGEQTLEQRGRSAQSISSPLLILDESSLSVLVVNRHIKISPCCSPRCSNTVSSEEQEEDLLSSLLGNDERPRLVVLHLLHVPPWKIHVWNKAVAASEPSAAGDCGQSREGAECTGVLADECQPTAYSPERGWVQHVRLPHLGTYLWF